MGKAIKRNLPCDSCGSSDAFEVYDDGSGYCFSCKEYTPPPHKGKREEGYSYQYVSMRGITERTMRRYGVRAKVDDTTGEVVAIGFPYDKGDSMKVRYFNPKNYRSQGDMKSATLFGMERFSPGEAKAITITEGEFDALAAHQMLGNYPVVSLRSSGTAKKDCKKVREYLNAFDKIYLCFDNDPVGEEAVKEVASLFDYNKVYHVKLGKRKDANEYLQNGEEKQFKKLWWASKKYIPKGIISTWREIDDIIDREPSATIGEYPFDTLNSMLYGLRSSEVVVFKAHEKVGKTEVLRSIEYHLLKNTDLSIGVIHLEENEQRTAQGLAGYELQLPAHKPDSGVTGKDVKQAIRSLSKVDDRIHIYSHFGSDDPDAIIDTIRSLVSVCGCRVVFLDHITMCVTGFEDEDERRKLDYISTKLAMMTRELDFTLVMVSHVNDDGKTRGSRNITKVADVIINLTRQIDAPDTQSRNRVYVTVEGNRPIGTTGPAGTLRFHDDTFTITEELFGDEED